MALYQDQLNRLLLRALGRLVLSHSAADKRPMELDLAAPLPTRVRVYVYHARRSKEEDPWSDYAVHLTVSGQRGQRSSFDHGGGRIAFVAGYASDEGVYILWDAGLHTNFPYRQRVRVRARTVLAASVGLLTREQRSVDGHQTETVLAADIDRLPEALMARRDLTYHRITQS